MEFIVVIIVFILIGLFSYIGNLNTKIDENEKVISNLKGELSWTNSLSRALVHSDYWIWYLINSMSLLNLLKNKQPLQIKKELWKFDEPRLTLLQFKEQKEKLKKIINLLEWDDLMNLQFILLSHWIKIERDWCDIIEWNLDPEFSYLPWFNLVMDDNMEIGNVGSIWKWLKQSALKIDMWMIIPREYSWSFDWESLYAFNYAQYLICHYILNRNSHLFDAISTVSTYFTDELDDLCNLLKK